MANTITLHQRQLFLSAGSPAEYAKVYFYESGTSTQVDVFSDVGMASSTQRSQPVVCSPLGVLPPCYTAFSGPIRITATDENDVNLSGYPMDNVLPVQAEALDASGTAFSPIDAVPETNVQAAIEAVAALALANPNLLARSFTPYPTGGTGNTYTITPSPAVTAYASGQSFWVRPDRVNTAAVTLNVSGLGARAWQRIGPAGTPVAHAEGEIQPYVEMLVYDDGTRLLTIDQNSSASWGSGVNGSWYRNGKLQVCWTLSVINQTIQDADTESGTWTFPKAFGSVPVVVPIGRATSDLAGAVAVAEGRATAGVGLIDGASVYYAVRNNNAAARTIRLDLFAIGWSF
jgi:hypothetical protein